MTARGIVIGDHTRRSFISRNSAGLLDAAFPGHLALASAAQHKSRSAASKPATDRKRVKLPPLDDKTERKEAPLPAPMRPSKRLGFAIAGLGQLALAQILPAFSACKYARPVALVSGHREKALQVADQYGIDHSGIYDYEHFDEIRNNPDIDVVYIVLPNALHEAFTIRAAQAGKHVLCEKPMATSAAAAERMIAACNKARVRLMIGYRIQHEPHHWQIRQWLQAQTYGQVKVINLFNGQHIGDPAQWRLKKDMGGGALGDIGIYCLNTARFLTGEEPLSIQATKYSTPGDPRFEEVEESILFQLHFPSGILANCSCSLGVHESRHYRCYADKGAWYGMDPAFPYKWLKMQVSEARGQQEWISCPSLGEQDQFALEMDHFALCLMNGHAPFTGGAEGLQDMKLMAAIMDAADSGAMIALDTVNGKDMFRGTPPSF